MTDADKALIHACKSRFPVQALEDVYVEHYGNYPREMPGALFLLLSDLCDKYVPFTAYKFAHAIIDTKKAGNRLFTVPMYQLRFAKKEAYPNGTF